MRNVAHGEHLLNQGILAMLWTVDPYDRSYRFLLHEVAESFLPVRYTDQLAPFLTEEEFVAARGVSPAARAMLAQLKRLLDDFESLRAVRPETMRRWEDWGVFG